MMWLFLFLQTSIASDVNQSVTASTRKNRIRYRLKPVGENLTGSGHYSSRVTGSRKEKSPMSSLFCESPVSCDGSWREGHWAVI